MIEDGIADHHAWLALQFFARFFRIPKVAHYVGAPVVDMVGVIGEQRHRTGIEINIPVAELEMQHRVCIFRLVDQVFSKQQEMYAHGMPGKTDEKMFALGFEIGDFLINEN